MSVELVTLADERGIPIYFVDMRTELGSLIDSRWFPTVLDALAFMAMGADL